MKLEQSQLNGSSKGDRQQTNSEYCMVNEQSNYQIMHIRLKNFFFVSGNMAEK